jgi:hypothetical protein
MDGDDMALAYRNLDQRTRDFAVEEINTDVASSTIYISPRLNPEGVQMWPALIREAALAHDDNWVAEEIRRLKLLNTHEERRKPRGGVAIVQIPTTAPDTLSEGEFNRYYVRGVCRRAIADNIREVEVYRARQSNNPRRESEALIGKRFDPKVLLTDLRNSQGVEPALGVPPGPNSGLCAFIP